MVRLKYLCDLTWETVFMTISVVKHAPVLQIGLFIIIERREIRFRTTENRKTEMVEVPLF